PFHGGRVLARRGVRPIASAEPEEDAPAPLRVSAFLEQRREVAEAVGRQWPDVHGSVPYAREGRRRGPHGPSFDRPSTGSYAPPVAEISPNPGRWAFRPIPPEPRSIVALIGARVLDAELA